MEDRRGAERGKEKGWVSIAATSALSSVRDAAVTTSETLTLLGRRLQDASLVSRLSDVHV